MTQGAAGGFRLHERWPVPGEGTFRDILAERAA